MKFDTDQAQAMPGVLVVLTSDDFAKDGLSNIPGNADRKGRGGALDRRCLKRRQYTGGLTSRCSLAFHSHRGG